MLEHFYTVKEFADILRVKPSSITRLIRLGRIQAFRIGTGKNSKYRIAHSEIERIQKIGYEQTLKAIEKLISNPSF